MEGIMMNLKKGMNFILSRFAAILLIAMTVLVLYQIFTRYVLSNPSDFTEEIVRYLLVWTGFIGAAYAFSTRQHMSLIFIKEKLSPGAAKAVNIIVNSIILLFAALIMVGGGTKLAISTVGARSALLNVSRGLVYSVGPISGIFIILGQIINIWEDIAGITLNINQEEDE